MLKFRIDAKRCTRCGKCVSDCPTMIIERVGGDVPFVRPAREEDCLECQHCLAICPTAALSIFGKDPADSLPLSDVHALPTFDQMTRFERGRRSVRQYRDENVDPALIRKMLATLANTPTGVNRQALTFTVIDDKDVMHRFRAKVLASLAEASENKRIPPHAAYLAEMVDAFKETGRDEIFRGAPHALIVSAPPDAPCPSEDVALALAYFELLAQSAGVGTVWWGMLKMVLENLTELKPLVGLVPGHFYYAMLFGMPAVRYARTVQRDGAAVIRRVEV